MNNPTTPQGQYEMGNKYYLGLGVKEDLRQAIFWYRKAADQGYADAQLRLGQIYEYGDGFGGIRKDYGQAKAWYQKAADQGDIDAKSILKRLEGAATPPAEATPTTPDVRSEPATIAAASPSKVAAAVPAAQPAAKTVSPRLAALPPLLIAADFPRPGRIYKLENNKLSEFYVRPSQSAYYGNGTLDSVAVSSEGTVYFADANNDYVFQLDNDRVEKPVYKHSTYVRDLGIDPDNRLYFSEASGGGGDGRIFRLDNGRAVPLYTVPLPEVDGFWAGTFAFDKSGSLWLSSGNISPAFLYKVEEGHPRKMFRSSKPIMGLRFTPDGDLLYADQNTIQRIQLPRFIASVAYSNDLLRSALDVEVIRSGP